MHLRLAAVVGDWFKKVQNTHKSDHDVILVQGCSLPGQIETPSRVEEAIVSLLMPESAQYLRWLS